MIPVLRQGADSTPKNAMRRDKQGESRQFEPMSWVARVLVVHLMQQGLKRRTETIRSSYGFLAGSPDTF